MYGISNSKTQNSVDTYGNVYGETQKSDWGKVFGESSEWYNISTAEWHYLLGTEEARKDKYGIGAVHSTLGLACPL